MVEVVRSVPLAEMTVSTGKPSKPISCVCASISMLFVWADCGIALPILPVRRLDRLQQFRAVVPHIVDRPADRPDTQHVVSSGPQQGHGVAARLAQPRRPVLR